MGGRGLADAEPAPSPATMVAAKMACGACVHPGCLLMKAAVDAIERGELPRLSADDACYMVVCTNALCNAGASIHSTCFEVKEDETSRGGRGSRLAAELRG